jgi:uncharacterized protein YbaP (TraB family)
VLLALSRLANAAGSTEPLDEVPVTAERPGPELWRVSQGDHVVWIFGALQPLPRHMTWRSKQIEEVLAEAQEVVPYTYRFDGIGLFTGLRLYFQWRKVRVNPHGATLQQVLPAPLYSRFAALEARYAPDDAGLERLQPMLASAELRERALSAAGLSTSGDVQDLILRLARKRHLTIRRLDLDIREPRALLGEVGSMPVEAQIHCFEPMITLLENDLGTLKARADAWAVGDVDALRALPVPDAEKGCFEAAADSPRLRALAAQAHDVWMQAVKDALVHNRSTLAVQDIGRLLGPDGWLLEFRRAGFEVDGPEFGAPH